jgi:antibiotic biosynthesis monooxygenase (ABM) superfamily enzyme
MNILQVLAIMIVCLAVANAVLFALGKISNLLFWIVIIVCAIIAYWVIPRIRKSTQDTSAIK